MTINSDLFEYVNGHGRLLNPEVAAAVLGEADAGAFDLALPRLAAQLRDYLVDLCQAGGADGVAPALQAAARVDRQPAAQRCCP